MIRSQAWDPILKNLKSKTNWEYKEGNNIRILSFVLKLFLETINKKLIHDVSEEYKKFY